MSPNQSIRIINSNNNNLLIGLTETQGYETEKVSTIVVNHHPSIIQLSPLDQIQPRNWVSAIFILEAHQVPLSMTDLKSSLVKVLECTPILTGRLEHIDGTRFDIINGTKDVQVRIDQSGAWYCENKVTIPFQTLKKNRFQLELLPSEILFKSAQIAIMKSLDATQPPAPLFCLKATQFPCGSIVVMTMFNHAIMDGVSLYEFYKAWGAAMLHQFPLNLTDGRTKFQVPVTSAINFTFPKLNEMKKNLIQSDMIKIIELSVTNPNLIQNLKQNTGVSFEDLFCAIIWRAVTRARNLDPNQSTRFQRAVDIRKFFQVPAMSICNGTYSLQTEPIQVDTLLHLPLINIAILLRNKLLELSPEFLQAYITNITQTYPKQDALPYSHFHFGTDLLCSSLAKMDASQIRFPVANIKFRPHLTTEGVVHILSKEGDIWSSQLVLSHQHAPSLLIDKELKMLGIKAIMNF